MLFINFATVLTIIIAVCGGIPRPHLKADEAGINVDNSARTPQWLESAFSSLKELAHDNIPVKKENRRHLDTVTKSDLTRDQEDDALPVLIHKEAELSGIKLPSISDADKTNPFMRTKRSTCAIPKNLPQLVQELNSFLNTSQIVGLDPQTPNHISIPVNQESTCPVNGTTGWWPRSEVNLRSTCPWNITEHDLGESAFPRYLHKATCLCESCIGNVRMGCDEIKQTVSYLYRLGCQGGLAVMETRNITITVGCHCVSASPQTAASGPISD